MEMRNYKRELRFFFPLSLFPFLSNISKLRQILLMAKKRKLRSTIFSTIRWMETLN